VHLLPAFPLCFLQFKTCYAQISDQKRKFLDAALRYIDLMRLVAGQAVDESDLKEVLEMATKCAIVAPAGPQRQRVMGTLIRDERIEIISVSDLSITVAVICLGIP
jgi:COP9 signalosome complex subunit 4